VPFPGGGLISTSKGSAPACSSASFQSLHIPSSAAARPRSSLARIITAVFSLMACAVSVPMRPTASAAAKTQIFAASQMVIGTDFPSRTTSSIAFPVGSSPLFCEAPKV
jgi:hypothetical protein